MKGLTSLTDSPFGIRILKRRPAWPGHEPARTQRLILAIIKINLPSTEAAARIDNLPSCAAKNFAHGRRWRFNDYAVTQAALARFCCRGKTRHETATAACWPRRKSKRISAVVANVIAPVHRGDNAPEPFLLHRAQEIARILSPAQARFCDRCCIEAASTMVVGEFTEPQQLSRQRPGPTQSNKPH